MNNTPKVASGPHEAPRSSPVLPLRDFEEQADEFEEALAAELIRKGVIERW